MIKSAASNVKKKIPVAAHLSDAEYTLLLSIYAEHNAAMSLEVRVKNDIGNVVKVNWNDEEYCLEVRYDNGDWWKYHVDGTWSL